MHHTISNINKTAEVQQYIDNRDGNKLVGVKSFTYTLGWSRYTKRERKTYSNSRWIL